MSINVSFNGGSYQIPSAGQKNPNWANALNAYLQALATGAATLSQANTFVGDQTFAGAATFTGEAGVIFTSGAAVFGGLSTDTLAVSAGIPLTLLQQSSAAPGQVIAWNGAAWAPANGGSGDALLAGNNSFTGSNTFSQAVLISGNLVPSVSGSITAGQIPVFNGTSGQVVPTTALSASQVPALSALSGSLSLGQLAQGGATTGQVLTWNGSAYAPSSPTSGAGTVTSVGLALPAIFTVSGSPVTGSGTLTATLSSQAANLVLASPNGSAGAPTIRALVAADIPVLDTSKITTGTFVSARLSGSYTGITGVGTLTAGSIPSSLLTGTVTAAQGGTGIATPTAGAILYGFNGTSLGTAGPNSTATNMFLRSVNSNSPGFAQVAFADLSGAIATGQVSGSYTGITGVGTLTAGSIPSTLVTGTTPVAQGGTGVTAATLGGLLYGSGTNTRAELAGNITAAKQFLSQTGTGTVSAAPVWAALTTSDIPAGYATLAGTQTFTGVNTFSTVTASSVSSPGAVTGSSVTATGTTLAASNGFVNGNFSLISGTYQGVTFAMGVWATGFVGTSLAGVYTNRLMLGGGGGVLGFGGQIIAINNGLIGLADTAAATGNASWAAGDFENAVAGATSVSQAQNGYNYNNFGATATLQVTLPTSPRVGTKVKLTVAAAFTMTVVPGGSNLIYMAGAGSVRTLLTLGATIGTVASLRYVATNIWVVEFAVGSLTLT